MQTQPLSRITVNEIEDILDALVELAADGELCRKDQALIRREIEEAYEAAIATDEAQAAGIAFIRNGAQSQRVRRLTRIYAIDHNHPDEAA